MRRCSSWGSFEPWPGLDSRLHRLAQGRRRDEHMSMPRVLTSEQIAAYEEYGFVQSISVLTPKEVHYYRGQLEKTWIAFRGRIARADGLHLFFRWAWELATHPPLLDCMEDLLGPNIILKHTRLFYKYPKSAS